MANLRETKLLKECFFTAVVGTVSKFSCKLCAEAGANTILEVAHGSGNTNFKAHLASQKHKGQWEERFIAYKARLLSSSEDISSSDAYQEQQQQELATSGGGSSMKSFLVPKYGAKTNAVFGLLKFLIDSKTVLPWTFCEDPVYRENLKCCASGMSAKSLKKWASKVVDAMVLKIKALLKNFGIIFDGKHTISVLNYCISKMNKLINL